MDDFISDVKENYKEAVAGWDHIYDSHRDDMKFVYGIDEGQWPDEIRRQRTNEKRPILTINKLQKFVRQLRGDQQMNRPRMKVIPVDDKSDVTTAELYNGIIRQIEYLSSADIAYDTAYMHAVSGSFGFFRLITEYVDDNSFDQEIKIKRIVNPLSVHFDPYAQEFTLEDAKDCFIEELVDKDDFKRLYKNAEMNDFESSTSSIFGDWLQMDKVRVAEYFYKDYMTKKIGMLSDGTTIPLDQKITRDAIREMGLEITRERTVEVPLVKWCKLTGVEVLEKADWPGKNIPVIPVFGDEIVVDGKRYYLSLTRGAKDPQRMYNYWATAATETVALAPKMPFIVDHRQVKGYETEWEEANISNRMFIRYKHVAGLQKPSRERQAEVPTGIIAMMQSTAYDIEDHLGKYESSKGETSNERSGRAILARIAQGDKGTFAFVDNLTRAIVYAGKQMIDLIPKIYDTPRALQIMGESGETSSVNINQPVVGQDGSITVANDLSVGKYDLIATTGASFGSKRMEMVRMMIESMQYAPQLAPVIAPLVFKYSDWPGAQEIYAKLTEEIRKQQVAIAQGQAQEQPMQ